MPTMPRSGLPAPLAVAMAVAAAALLMLLGLWLTAREFNARTVEEQGRNLRERLLLRVAPAITALQLAGDLLAAAAPGRPTPADARELVLSSLDNNPGVDAVTVCDGRGLLAMAVRAHSGMLLHVRSPAGPVGSNGSDGSDGLDGSDGGQGTPWLRINTDATPPGPGAPMPPATGELCRRMVAATNAQAARVESGRKTATAWTGVHPLPMASAAPGHNAGAGAASPVSSAAMTVVVDARDRQGRGERSMGYSFRLDGLLTSLAVGLPKEARVLVTSPHGDSRSPREAASLTEDGDPVHKAALAAWSAAGMPADAAFTFEAQGSRWWAYLAPATDADTRTFAGVAMPQGLLLHTLLRDAAVPLLLACGGLAVLLVAWWTHARRGAPGADTGPLSDDALRTLLAGGESDRLEFKSTLRHNLSSGKHGKEIELAALKTVAAFLNTDGGTLAVGVDDQGQVLGPAPDGFEDADHVLRHFSALLAQHIGVEHQPHVRFTVRMLDGRQLLLVECGKAAEPVILHTGKEEEFYVRMGPTSRKLALSQVMHRLRGNGAQRE
ncbi:ATP-binding protein [Nitratidesulfovibrio liaohensis]|uniref:ATP-binding protein n=1 Tax=Nitratidesulfovibrio liaohensis TaxID=2604158 RepID=A0ABY9R5V0_9BACT|nr:ATP-binding protein [Nitratidesulfovibrio liaohensis]WMW67116.1 ATP-binding protein [Nitratidesulfovibrio liaohensis]